MPDVRVKVENSKQIIEMVGLDCSLWYRPLSKLRNRFARLTHRWQKKAHQVHEECRHPRCLSVVAP